MRYEPTIAIPRLVELLKNLELQQTFFMPGWVIERYPATVDLLLDNGHEIGLHGYMHERSHDLSLEEEAKLLDRAIEAYVRQVGVKPRGWRAPGFTFSDRSADLLVDTGFEYDSSLMGGEIPSVLATERGSLIEFPVDWTSDDWPHYMHNRDFDFMMPISAPSRAMEVFRAEFDATRDYGAHWITVWHPFLSGRLARLSAIVDLIAYMRECDHVWFARLDQVCSHVQSLIQSKTWTPRVDRLPFHQRPDID
ncbi:polysaccharide deacetylase family protein [Pseudochelatococcus sp. B33]